LKKILIIEDEAAFREAIAFALESEGYAVLQAESAVDGIEIARARIPDLILSDVLMDSVDGYEAVISIRQDPRTTGIPIILMTGKPDKEGLVHALELGADDYLTKPFAVPALLEAVAIRFRKQEETRKKHGKGTTDPRAYLTVGIPGDLRTPLAGILGFSKAVSREHVELKKSEIIELGRAIQKAARSVLRMTENFSVLAQIEILAADQDKVERLRMYPTKDPGSTIEYVSAEIANHYERSEDLVIVVAPGAVSCSPEYLSKITHELVDNAFKFSGKGQKVQVSGAFTNGTFMLIVTDFGRGMTPTQIDDINSYSSLHSRFHDEHYFGWGLIAAKRLAEIHGGSLQLSSTGAPGLMVRVSIPRARDQG
jgi:DNA-binding response OmpR family regulator